MDLLVPTVSANRAGGSVFQGYDNWVRSGRPRLCSSTSSDAPGGVGPSRATEHPTERTGKSERWISGLAGRSACGPADPISAPGNRELVLVVAHRSVAGPGAGLGDLDTSSSSGDAAASLALGRPCIRSVSPIWGDAHPLDRASVGERRQRRLKASTQRSGLSTQRSIFSGTRSRLRCRRRVMKRTDRAVATAPARGNTARRLPLVIAGAMGIVSPGALGMGVAQGAVPSFPDNIVVFPDRELVTIEGYQDHLGETAIVEVKRAGVVIGSAQSIVGPGDVAFEVNHPGGACWGRAPASRSPRTSGPATRSPSASVPVSRTAPPRQMPTSTPTRP